MFKTTGLAAGLAAALCLGVVGGAAAQLPNLDDLAGGLVKDAIKDQVGDAIGDAALDYLGIEKDDPRPAAAPAPAPPPRRAPAVREALVSGADPEAVREVISGWGSANLANTADGEPRISGRMEGILYSVRFYGCRRGANCGQVVFSSGFAGVSATQESVNAWNREKVFGRAFLSDGGDAVLEMPVNLRFGVSKENLDDTVDLWRIALLDFRDSLAE